MLSSGQMLSRRSTVGEAMTAAARVLYPGQGEVGSAVRSG
jgi:hypothetical protein